MNKQSQHSQNIELHKIKRNVSDAFLKIQIQEDGNRFSFSLLEFNQHAANLFDLSENSEFDIIHKLEVTLSADVDWRRMITSVFQEQLDNTFDIVSSKPNLTYKVAIMELPDSVVMLYFNEKNRSKTSIHQKPKVLEIDQFVFQNLMDKMSCVVLIVNEKGSIVQANDIVVNKLGYSRKELCSLELTDLFGNSVADFSEFLSYFQSDKLHQIPLIYHTKSEDVLRVETTLIRSDWDDKPVYFVVGKDLSELTSSEEKFSKAFNSNPTLMAITTPEGFAVELNESFLQTTGYTWNEFISKEVSAVDLLDSPVVFQRIRAQLKKDGQIRNLEINLVTKDKKTLNCVLSADFIKSHNSTYILVVINNVSERHQLTMRLDMAMKTARLAWYEFDMINGDVIAGDNKAAMLGYDPAVYKNQHYSTWTNLIHPDDYQSVMENMKDCMLKKSDLYQVDYRIKRADGNYAWFFDRGVVFEHTDDGTPKRMTGIVVDISDRKATERKLEQTLREYEYATNNVRSIIWKTEISKEGEFMNSFISKVADKILGYDGESLNHDLYKYLSHIHPNDKDVVFDNIQKVMEPGAKSEFEYRIIKTNGEVAWLFTQSATEADDEGRISIFGVTIDMSQRTIAAMEIEKQQKFLNKLFDTIPSMIAVKDESGRYTNVNTRFADFYKLKPQDILGKKDGEFIEESWAYELSKYDKSIIERGEPKHYKNHHKTEDGEFFFDVSKVPIKNPETNQNQLLLVSNDITSQVLAKQHVEQKTRELLMLTEHINVQIWYLKDPESYGIVNKAHANFIGKSKQEIEHKNIHLLFDDKFAQDYISDNRLCFEEKRSRQFEKWNFRTDGTKRLLKITKTPMIEEDGRVSFVICTAQDISKEHFAQKALKKAINFNQLLIDTSPIGILVYQTTGECILVNDAAVKIVGAKSSEDVMRNNIYKTHSWKENGLIHYFNQSLNRKEKIQADIFMTTSYGKSLWIDFIFQQIEYLGNPHVMVIVDEITEVKEQELNIQNNLNRQRTLSKIAFQLSELDDFNNNIDRSLETIGEFMDVSRVYIFKNSKDNETYSNTFEWCNRGVSSQINHLQNVSYHGNPEWKQRLADNLPIYTDDIRKLAPEFTMELEPQSIKSLVIYPLFMFKKFSGFIGFDENTHHRQWSEDDFEFLQTISHIIANTFERKIIGDDLRESEEMFKKITGGAMDGIVLLDSKGEVSYWNPAAESIFGYTRNEMLGNNLHKLLASNDNRQNYEQNKPAFAQQGIGNMVGKNIELSAYHKNSTPIDIELSLSSLKIKGEWHALGIVRDITERKYAENQLKTLSKAVEFASAGIVITDVNGSIEYVNNKFCEITGYSKEEVYGQNPSVLASGKHSTSFYQQLWETIKQGKEWKGEFLNMRKNGENYYESALISSVTDDSGAILHYIGIKEDITNEKNARAELIKAKQNAETANRQSLTF
jgi:PAS domain S-box-containing protein